MPAQMPMQRGSLESVDRAIQRRRKQVGLQCWSVKSSVRHSTAHLSICFLMKFLKRQRKGVKSVEIVIRGDPKEIAALVLAVQERQISVDEVMKQIANQIASELSSVRIL